MGARETADHTIPVEPKRRRGETKEARQLRQRAELDQFLLVLHRAGNSILPEATVCEGRKWRVDYLIAAGPMAFTPRNGPDMRPPIALEIQGFGFGHLGRKGWLRDIEKACAIAANGWLYVPVTREMVGNGDALEVLSRCGVPVDAWVKVKCVECYDTGRVAYLGAKYAIGSPCPNGCVPVEGK